MSDILKHEIVQEVLSGSMNKEEARRRYGIRGKSAILKWMRKFGYISNIESVTLKKQQENRRTSSC